MHEVLKTIETIENLIKMACLGVQKAVNKMQIESGIKDRTAMYWIEQVIPIAHTQLHDRITSKTMCNICLNQHLKTEEHAQIVSEIKADIQKTLLE
jgi:hypothetical protein